MLLHGKLTRTVGWLSVLSLLLAAGCEPKGKPAGSPGKDGGQAVTICHGSVTDILPRLAFEQGYFREEGLSVTIRQMSDGKRAFDRMLAGDCTFSVTGVPPLVATPPSVTNVTVVATVMSDDDATRIIARKDRGIQRPRDLKGKRIGLKKGIIGHFFLDLFLARHGMSSDDVTLMFMEPDRFISALEKGDIDGFSMTEKMVNEAAGKLGNRGIVFSEPGLHVIYGVLATRTDQPLNLQVTPHLLRALLRAEQYAREQPAAAKALLSRAADLSAAQMDAIWNRTTIRLELANALLTSMEDQYQWQLERGFIPRSAGFPDYLTVISPQYLAAIKPGAVSVIKK